MEEMKKDEALEEQQTTAEAAEAVLPEPEPLPSHWVDAQPNTFTRVISSERGRVLFSFFKRTAPSASIWAARRRLL